MDYEFQLIDYAKDLTKPQQENYNFQKVAGRLADYGFNCMRLTDDWEGADFLAVHKDGNHFLKVQLKGRLYIAKKYQGKEIYIAFPNEENIYIYPHDTMVDLIDKNLKATQTQSWTEDGHYGFPKLPPKIKDHLEKYKI